MNKQQRTNNKQQRTNNKQQRTNNKITRLNSTEKALIPAYREKWRAYGLSTEPIDHQLAAEIIQNLYGFLNLSPPELLFVDSPAEGLELVLHCNQENMYGKLHWFFNRKLWRKITLQLDSRVLNKLEIELEMALALQLFSQYSLHVCNQIGISGNPHIRPEMWAGYGSWLDFAMELLHCKCDRYIWNSFQSLIMDCGNVYMYEKMAVICDRPHRLTFDPERRLHGSGVPAIEYGDDFKVYAYHGVRLPEKYGSLPDYQWQPEWLLSEKNAEMRRVLIQTIGYKRICEALQAVELDSWREYTLIKIENEVDVEPIHLLRMTCPSTGRIHVLRVPPERRSALEAISWINWDIDPKDFALST